MVLIYFTFFSRLDTIVWLITMFAMGTFLKVEFKYVDLEANHEVIAF